MDVLSNLNVKAALDLATTWGDSAVAATALKVNVTDTASAATSNLVDVQVGGTSKFKITKYGEVAVVAGARTNVPAVTFSNLGEGADFLQASWASGGFFNIHNTGGRVTFGITNRAGLKIDVNGIGSAEGNVTFINDANSLTAGGPLVSFLTNVRKADIGQTGSINSYNVYTSATSYERGKLAWESNALKIGTDKGSAGGTARDLALQTDGVDRLTITAAGAVNVLGAFTIAGVAPLTANQTITLSGDLSGSGSTAINVTLATVNSNVGSFGSTTQTPVITVNAKGQVTAASNASIAFPVTSVNAQTGAVTLTTSGVGEGTNLYFTDARVRANRLDQMAAPTAAVSLNGQKITGLADPTAAQEAATKAYVDGVNQSVANRFELVVAASDESTALAVGTGKVTFRLPRSVVLTQVRASLTVAQTSGSILTVDIKAGGSSILSTALTIDNGEKTSTTAAAPAVISTSSLADDTEITIDITQVGNGTAKGLKVALIGSST